MGVPSAEVTLDQLEHDEARFCRDVASASRAFHDDGNNTQSRMNKAFLP